MESLQAGNLSTDILHRHPSRRDAIVAEQAADLNPHRDKRDQVNQSQRAKERPTNQEVGGNLRALPPTKAREQGEEAPMLRHESIKPFTAAGENGGMNVPIQQPTFARVFRERTQRRFRASEDRTIGLKEMDGRFQLLARQLGKPVWNGW